MTGSTRTIKLIYLIEAFAGLSRGSYLVCFGWTTLIVTGDVAKVGQVFVVSMLTILLGSHLIGMLVDRANRRRFIVLSHALIGVSMACTGWLLSDQGAPHTTVLFCAVVVITLGRLSYETALEVTIKEVSEKGFLITTLARARTIHLLSTAIITVIAGWCLAAFPTEVAFYMSASMSGFVVLMGLFLPSLPAVSSNNTMRVSSWNAFIQGFKVLKETPALVPVVLLAGLALPIGQLSNAILSSFVHDDLTLGSREFGLIDGAWPVGGLFATFAIGALSHGWTARLRLSVTTALIAVSTILLALATDVLVLAILHAAMGLFTWMSRILVDARVLETAPIDQAGRAKSNVTFAFSATAIIMCLSPSLLPGFATGTYFLAWGATILVAAILYELHSRRCAGRFG